VAPGIGPRDLDLAKYFVFTQPGIPRVNEVLGTLLSTP
jgi:hypothetical protein